MHVSGAESADALSLLRRLLIMTPIAVAIGLILLSSYVLAGVPGYDAPALALAGAAVTLVAAACAAWLVIERSLARQLRIMTSVLRAAKNGQSLEGQRCGGGAIQDVMDLARDIVQTRVDAGRIVGAIADFARATKADHATMTSAIVAIARDPESTRPTGYPEVRLDQIRATIEDSVAGAIARRDPTGAVKSELEAIRRRVETTVAETKTIGEAVRLARSDLQENVATRIDALRDAMDAHKPGSDGRLDFILERIERLPPFLPGARNAGADSKAKSVGDAPILASIRDLGADLRLRVTSIDDRLDRALSSGDLGPAIARIEHAAHGLDQSAKEVGRVGMEIGASALRIGATTVPEHAAALLSAVRSIKDLSAEINRSRAGSGNAPIETMQHSADGIATGIDQLRPVLEGLSNRVEALTVDSKQTVGALPDIARVLGDIRLALAARPDAMAALTSSGAEADAAADTRDQKHFVILSDRLDGIDRRLETIATDGSKTAVVLNVVNDTRRVLGAHIVGGGAQAAKLSALSQSMDKALALLTEPGPNAHGLHEIKGLAHAIEDIKSHLVAIEHHIKGDASREFRRDARGAAADDHGRTLGVIASNAEQAVMLLSQLKAAADRKPDPIGAKLFTEGLDSIKSGLMAMRQDLSTAFSPLEHGSNDRPATASDLVLGLDAIHDRLAAITARIDETVATADGRDATRVSDAQAATQRVMDAILATRGLLTAGSSVVTETTPRLLPSDTAGLLGRLDEVTGRLDHVAERLDGLVDEAPALARDERPDRGGWNQEAVLAIEAVAPILARIDDVAARLEGMAEVLDDLGHRQNAGRRQNVGQPTLTEALGPVVAQVTKLSESLDQGVVRLAGQFSQLSSAVATIPQTVTRDTRALIETRVIDPVAMNRRFDALREGLADVTELLRSEDVADARDSSPLMGHAAGVATTGSRFDTDPIAFISAELDVLHSRFDQLTNRVEHLADALDRPLGFGATRDAVGEGILGRLVELQATVAKGASADLAPIARRLETASQTLASSIAEWRNAGSPMTRDDLEQAFAGLDKHPRDTDGAETRLHPFNELRLAFRHGVGVPTNPVGIPTIGMDGPDSTGAFDDALVALHRRFDDLSARLERLAPARLNEAREMSLSQSQGMMAFKAEMDATVAPIRELTSVAATLIARSRSTIEPSGPERSSLPWQETVTHAFGVTASALSDIKARLDRLQTCVDAMSRHTDTDDETRERLKSITDMFNEKGLTARLEQSNQAIAETLMSFESRMEQPIAALRESLAVAQLVMGRAFASSSSDASAIPLLDANASEETPSLVKALKAMGGFMAAIEERFTAVEALVREGAMAPDGPAHLASFNDGILEMRRLTHDFLDISCAITGELADHAKTEAGKVARG